MIKNNKQFNRALFFLLALALLVTMIGCGGSAKPQVKRSEPENKLKEEKKDEKKEEKKEEEKNPTEAMAGVWETKDPFARLQSGGTTDFVRWQISKGTKKDDVYNGRIVDLSSKNLEVADYKLRSDNTISLTVKAGPLKGQSFSYSYKVSDEGNTITLEGDKPIILKRGTSNTDILKDAQTVSAKAYKLDRDVSRKLFSKQVSVAFEKPTKYKEGYGGKLTFTHQPATGPAQKVADWSYTIIEKEKIEIKDGKGTKEATYKILNDGKILQIDFADDTPDLYMNR